MRDWLESLYHAYHHPSHLGSDPLQFVHRYRDPADQEIVGLIAASLAYGNVTSINRSIEEVLRRMPGSPAEFLRANDEQNLRRTMAGFRHRWTGPDELADVLVGVRRAIQAYGSLGRLFVALDAPGEDLGITLARWVGTLRGARSLRRKELLSDPARNSASKRLHLYLRWMVRKDAIDPGSWSGIDPARLIMPLDTHIFAFARACRLTRRTTPDGRAAREITEVFRRIRPDDPVRYDFSLTRPGIIDGWRPGRRAPWHERSSSMPANASKSPNFPLCVLDVV